MIGQMNAKKAAGSKDWVFLNIFQAYPIEIVAIDVEIPDTWKKIAPDQGKIFIIIKPF